MKISQAVILAGGRGERMHPFTDTMPKPMVPINGKPFLEHLIELLKKNDIEEVVLLLGYKHEKITEHFGDGSKFGIRIVYSIGAVEDETGTRIRNAKKLLKDEFLLLYCDNYWPLRLARLYTFHKQQGKLATVTVYSNTRGVTKNNMRVTGSLVEECDRSRKNPNLNGVDLGFFILNKKVFDAVPDTNFSFEQEILPKLVAAQELAAHMTHERHYSIGSPDRLPLTAKYLSERKIIFLDRDGVINRRPPQADYVKKWSEFSFLPQALPALALLNKNGYELYLISNQPGVARGAMSKDDLDDINRNFIAAVEKAGGKIHSIYQCLHGWDDDCPCRKPKAGMFYDAAFEHDIDLSKAFFVGDDERDLEAGQAASVKTHLMASDGDLLAAVTMLVEGRNPAFMA